MKKLNLKRKSKQPEQAPPSRITNETVAEHRERILAGGRKFKYPHQYVRHKLVINAVIISVVALILLLAIGWWLLYPQQNTSNFMYRVTRVIPVPVASVDGAQVKYSDYLMRYRSQELWLRTQGQLGQKEADNQRQLDYIKRSVLDTLESDVYAQKKARELKLGITNEELQSVIDDQRNTVSGKISQEAYDDSTQHLLGISPDEYRHILRQSLLRQKVAYFVDTKAKQQADEVKNFISGQKNKTNALNGAVAAFKKQGVTLEFGASGQVPRNNRDGGLARAALLLKDGQISERIESTNGDGYYFVQRLSADSRQVSYQYIKIPLTVFKQEFEQLKKDGKIAEFISIDAVAQKQ